MSVPSGNELFREGIILFKCEKYQKASEIFQMVIDQDDEYHKAWNALGVSLSRTGDHKNAKICFENALILDPDNETYSKNLITLTLKKKLIKKITPLSKRKRTPSNQKLNKKYILITSSFLFVFGVFILIIALMAGIPPSIQTGVHLYQPTPVPLPLEHIQTTADLRAYYSFNDGSAHDSSGNNFTGVFVGGKVVNGISGKAIQLDGKSELVTLPDLYSHNPDSVTYMAFCRPNIQNSSRNDGLETMGAIFFNGIYHSVLGITYTNTTTLALKINRSSGPSEWNSLGSSIISTNGNSWTHITGVIDMVNNSSKIYINGELNSFSTLPAGTFDVEKKGYFVSIGAFDSLYIGRKDFFNGTIDEVRIFEGILSDSDIENLYHSYFSNDTSSPSISLLPTIQS